jgi:hypothetical protein
LPAVEPEEFIEKKRQQERRKFLLEFLGKNPALIQFNSKYLTKFVGNWRQAAYHLQQKTEVKSKTQSLELSFFEIEIDQVEKQ